MLAAEVAMNRGLTYANAIAYIGVKRRTFYAHWRPRLTALPQGTALIFDRSEIDRLFDQFKLQCATAIFVGHSVSAMIGAIAHIKAPDRFAAHVMIAPSPCYINDGDYIGGFTRADIGSLLDALEDNYLGWASSIAPVIMGAPNQLSVELTQSFCRVNPDIAKHFARVTFLSDTRAELFKLAVPTLIVPSSNDAIAPQAVGEYLHRQLPHSMLRVIENVGHCPHLSAPKACAEAMNEFLATI